MTTTDSSVRILPGKPERLATRIAFFILGFGYAAWAPLVPFAQTRTNLNEGELGLLLLCLGVGSIIAMPVAGNMAARFGCRRVLIGASGLICLTLPLLATISNLNLLVPALFVFGAGVGSADCVVNIQAVIVERASGRSLMSGFHGLFSVGGIAGAGGVSALLSMGASPLTATLCAILILLLALLYAAPRFLSYGSETEGPAFAIPHGLVLLIGILCFVVFLTEGAVLDWSAVFLSTERGMNPARAGLGYTAFSFTMMIGRFTGDAIVNRFGGISVLIAGALFAAAGLALATLIPYWQVTLLGYALVGIGCSNIVPVLFSAVGKQTVMPEHLAIPAVVTLGYAGMLAGPALIGFVAHSTSISIAFLGLVALLLGVAVGGRSLAD